jgi:hypothetical protein
MSRRAWHFCATSRREPRYNPYWSLSRQWFYEYEWFDEFFWTIGVLPLVTLMATAVSLCAEVPRAEHPRPGAWRAGESLIRWTGF